MDKLLRIIDANLNRSQEGLRVCEDIVRFVLNDRRSSRSFKSLRHVVGNLGKKLYSTEPRLLSSRNVSGDVGKKTNRYERKRKDIKAIFRANTQRTKEALRVLEEISKLKDKKISQRFKGARFKIYELEKKSAVRLENILHRR